MREPRKRTGLPDLSRAPPSVFRFAAKRESKLVPLAISESEGEVRPADRPPSLSSSPHLGAARRE